jgi:hypothetical protein
VGIQRKIKLRLVSENASTGILAINQIASSGMSKLKHDGPTEGLKWLTGK